MVVGSVHTSTLVENKANEHLRHTAVRLEAAFLAEMLGSAGLGRALDASKDGQSEGHFASLLVQEQATALAQRGGIGLAELIYSSILEQSGGT